MPISGNDKVITLNEGLPPGQSFVSGAPPRIDRQSYEEASREAALKPHEFNAKERSNYVRTMVARTVEYQRERKTIEEIKERLPEFARDYKHLFEMITSPEGYDASNLQVMISMLEHMDKGNLTQHDASVIVGKRLYSKYGSNPKKET